MTKIFLAINVIFLTTLLFIQNEEVEDLDSSDNFTPKLKENRDYAYTLLAQHQNQKAEDIFISKSGTKVYYAYNLPLNYDSSKSYNILIAPGGGTADDANDFILWGNKTDNYNWIFIETEAIIGTKKFNIVKDFFDHLRYKFKPVSDKFHLMGFSANSVSPFKIALTMPDYVLSVTGVPGHPRTNNEAELSKLKSVKVNFIVGENDGHCLNSAQKFHNTLKKIGVEVKLNVVKKGEHKLTQIVGDKFMSYMSWLKQ